VTHPYAGTLEGNLLIFMQRLRQADFLLGAAETALALTALSRFGISDKESARLSLRLICATSPHERRQFDLLFEQFWGGLLLSSQPEPPPFQLLPKPRRLQTLSMVDWQQGCDSDEQIDTMGYSTQEVMSSAEGQIHLLSEQALRRWVARLARYLFARPSRRWVPTTTRAAMLDVRRSIRRSLATGGELVHLSHKTRELGKSRVVFIFDVSGSMMVYSHFLLQLAYAFVRQRRLGKSEAFAFSTDCYYLTPALAEGGIVPALKAARQAMPGRSGGTRIGYCLSQLLERYGRSFDPRSSVIICSDGWDTGDLERLEVAMRILKARTRQIIWLNPLAASPGYEPTAGGMRTALPFIDIFAPAHNPESLHQLEAALRRRA
jgi:uncharacterized protein with von Willebrand factor type A (vWA) domain